jgi:hypothetical protein
VALDEEKSLSRLTEQGRTGVFCWIWRMVGDDTLGNCEAGVAEGVRKEAEFGRLMRIYPTLDFGIPSPDA